MDKVSDNLDISMNNENPDDHITNIERINWVVQERSRMAYYMLPYKKIPRLMICHLEIIVTTKLNLFTDKGGILAY